MSMNIMPSVLFHNINFASNKPENRETAPKTSASSNPPTAPLSKDMFSGSLVTPDVRNKQILTALNGITSKNDNERRNAWHTLANIAEYNNGGIDLVTVIKAMPDALTSQNLVERTFATRVFRATSQQFPKDDHLTNLLIENMKSDNPYLYGVSTTALKNRFNEGKLEDRHIDTIMPILTEHLEQEEDRPIQYLGFLKDIVDKKKINKDNAGRLPEVLGKKISTINSNQLSTNCTDLLLKLEKDGALKVSSIKYISIGLTSDKENENKRALHFLNQNIDLIDEKNAEFVTPQLLKTINANDDVIRSQSITIARVLNSKDLVPKDELEKLKPEVISAMGSENNIIASGAANFLNDMVRTEKVSSLDLSKDIDNIIKNMGSTNDLTRKAVCKTVAIIADDVPTKARKVILNKGIELSNSDNYDDRIMGYKIVKNYMTKDDLYKSFSEPINDMIIHHFDSEDIRERKNISRIFDNIFESYGGNIRETQTLANKLYDHISENKPYKQSALPLLKTVVKFSAMKISQADDVSENLIPMISSEDDKEKIESLFLLGRLVNKHLLTPEKEEKVTKLLNEVDDVSDSMRATFERELISRNALTEENKQRVIESLYSNLNSPDIKIRTATMRSLPDLYTRQVLPRERDEKIVSAVISAVFSDDRITRNSGIKALGDMAQERALSQEDVEKCLPVIQNEIINPTNKISGGIALKTFGQFAYNHNIKPRTIAEMEPYMLNYLRGDDMINKTIALEAYGNATKVRGVHLSHQSVFALHDTIPELFRDKNIATRGSVLKAMTNLEHARVLNKKFARNVVPQIIERDLLSVETRHRSKAVNFLRMMKLHNKLTEEQMKRIDEILDSYPKDCPNRVLANLIQSYKETVPETRY